MLAIRFQRVGRTGHAEFRIVVQESRRTPSSGNIVAQIGHYNPHTKVATLNKEKAAFYVGHGAQPSTRVALLMKNEGVKLPDWVKFDSSKVKSVKKADKLRVKTPATKEPAAEPTTKVEAPEEASKEAPEKESAPAESIQA